MKELWDIVVMCGGQSAEREVSLKSGKAVADALRLCGHRVISLDPIGEWVLPKKVDVIFLALHGTGGEDGSIQSKLETMGIAYTGCGPASSALAFDKVKSKEAFIRNGIPTPHCFIRDAVDFKMPDWLTPPVIIKPACQGSSLGVEMLEDFRDWKQRFQKVLSFGRPAIVEEFIGGREIAVGVVDNEVLPIVEVQPKSGFYSYENKYTDGATDYICPASFSQKQTEAIGEAAKAAFEAIGGGDYARVDFMVRGEEFFVLEINTLPGMTPLSLLPKAAAAKGESFPQLCHRLVTLARKGCKNHSINPFHQSPNRSFNQLSNGI